MTLVRDRERVFECPGHVSEKSEGWSSWKRASQSHVSDSPSETNFMQLTVGSPGGSTEYRMLAWLIMRNSVRACSWKSVFEHICVCVHTCVRGVCVCAWYLWPWSDYRAARSMEDKRIELGERICHTLDWWTTNASYTLWRHYIRESLRRWMNS